MYFQKFTRTSLLLAALMLCATPAFAASLGDPAAPIQAAEWVQGEPVDMAAGKGEKIYVVEFWATWCAPCVQTIPHLTEVQEKYADKGVVVIGVSDEEPEVVRPFVKKMGDKMKYRVVADKDQKTAAAYMMAYNKQSIPTAFIVDKQGRVAWVGHPLDGMDEAIEQMVAGTYDMSKILNQQKAERALALIEVAASLTELGEKELAGTVLNRIEKLAPANFEVQGQAAWMMVVLFKADQIELEPVLRMASAAHRSEDGKHPIFTSALARAKFLNGEASEAVALQKQAIEHAGSLNLKFREAFDKFLAEYQGAAQ